MVKILTDRAATLDDFRRAGRADGEFAAREQISVRRELNEAEMDAWLRNLWFRRIPDRIVRLRENGAAQKHLDQYLAAFRRENQKHLRSFQAEVNHAAAVNDESVTERSFCEASD